MALTFKGTQIENVYYKGTKIDKVYYKGTLVYESTIYIAKPTVSGSYTFDNANHSASISYNSAGCTQSGTATAKSSGTYTVTFTLNKGYAWADGSTDALSYTWKIAKRKLTKTPSLSATSFKWVEGTTHSVTVKNRDTSYVNQSGTVSQKDSSSNIGSKYTVTWSLKYPNDTTWADGTTANKTATWSVVWGNGTSHYSNDLYNQGWKGDIVACNSGATFNSDHIYFDSSKASTQKWCVVATKNQLANGKTIHALLYGKTSSAYAGRIGLGYTVYIASSSAWNVHPDVKTSGATISTSWSTYKEVKLTTSENYYGIGTDGSGTFTVYIQRIWVT